MEAPTVAVAKPKLSGVFGVLLLTQLLSLGLSCFLGAAFGSGVAAEHREALADGRMTQGELGAKLMANPDFLIGMLVFSQLAIALGLWQGLRLFDDVAPGQYRRRLGWNEEAVRWREVALLTLGSFAVGSLVLGALRLVEGTRATGALERLGTVSSASSPAQFAMLLLFGAVGAAITEELLFRGYLQQRLVERWGPVTGITVTALIFGLWHFDARQGLFAVAVGCWLGFGALRCGTVVTGALAHLLNNATSFVGSRLSPQRDDEGLAVAVGLSAVVLAGCVYALVRSTRPNGERAPEGAAAPPT
jgi:membrane protease YdiL (CAAX protease family)